MSSSPQVLGPKRRVSLVGSIVSGRVNLPPEMLNEARLRLRSLALLCVTLVFFFVGITALTSIGPPAIHSTRSMVMMAAFAALSMGVYALCRRPLPGRVTMNLGLAYEVVGALVTSLFVNQNPWPEQLTLPGWSPIAVWVLIFPVLVPATPRRVLIASVLAAAMDPLGVLLLVGLDVMPLPSESALVFRFTPHAAVVVFAVVASRVVYRLGTEVQRAREMGNYQLVERLGAGGMGEVWHARHRMLARPAAIKLIRSDALGGTDLTTIRRFEREAQATAQLCSGHTVGLYDFGVTEDGTFYYVMELLDGLDLNTLVERFGPQPPERVVPILEQICHSLHEAHSVGLIHRDIKPANIFLCRYGSDLDFVKVLDFGLVKETTEQRASLTQEGLTTGTPAFISPEMVMRDRPIDGRSDLYSLGCVAFWLLTGQLVFEAETGLRMMIFHAQSQAPPVSAMSEFDIPPELEALVGSLLEKAPEARPETAEDVRQVLRAMPIEGRWDTARAAAWWDRHLPSATRGDSPSTSGGFKRVKTL